MAPPSTIALNMALLALLSFTHLHFKVQAGAWGPTAGGGGQDDDTAAAEFVLLERIPPERLLLAPATAAGAVNSTDDDEGDDTQMTELMCLECDCCLKNTKPQVCLTKCCYKRVCGESVCSIPEVVACGCNNCVPPPPHHSHRPPPLPPPQTTN